MKELKFTITGTMFVPDNAEYECNFENQIYSFKIGDKTYSLIAGLEADEKEIIVQMIISNLMTLDFSSMRMPTLKIEKIYLYG